MAKRKSVYFDRETISFIGITDEIRSKLVQTYNWVDLDFELNKMSLWLMSPKGCKRKGTLDFISGWLSRLPRPIELFNQVSVPDSTNSDHLEAIWKQAGPLLNMNEDILLNTNTTRSLTKQNSVPLIQ